MNSTTSNSRTLALLVWRRWARPGSPARPRPLARPANALARARAEALQGYAWENTVWAALALSGLALVLLSFWL